MLLHRQQFQRGDAEAFEVGDHHRVPQRGETAAQRRRDLRVQQRQAAHVRFVNHRLPPGRGGRAIVLPVVLFVHHHAFRHQLGAVVRIRLFVTAVQVRVIRHRPLHRARGRIERQLVGVETLPVRRVERAVDPVTVTLPRPAARQIAMPDIAAARRQRQAHFALLAVEQAQLHPLGVRRVQGKVDAFAVVMGAQRRGEAGRQLRHGASRSR